MSKNIRIFSILICLIMLLGACDARRNQILSNILVSPTATETMAPPTETPTITPSPTVTLTPTPVIVVENMDLLLFGDYDRAEHDIQEKIEKAADGLDILRAQTDLLESAWAQSDYKRCLSIMNDFTDTLQTTQNRPKAILSKAYYLYAQCAAEEGMKKEEISGLEKYIEYSPDSPILAEVINESAYAYQELEDYEMFRNYLDISAARSENGLNEYQRLDYALSFSHEGNRDEAIRLLTDLYNASVDENIKAAADYYLGSIYNDQGLSDQVIARYQDIVNNYPKSYYSYLALLWLLDNDQTVSEYQRGLVTTAADGTLQVRTTGNQGSGVLSSMVQANGLIVLHHGQGNVAPGDMVDVMMFDGVI